MRCRKLIPESKMHKLMRFHEITPGSNLNQIQIQYRIIGIKKKVGLSVNCQHFLLDNNPNASFGSNTL
jgi:hypothetical protein